jgi:hypothetical protein
MLLRGSPQAGSGLAQKYKTMVERLALAYLENYDCKKYFNMVYRGLSIIISFVT